MISFKTLNEKGTEYRLVFRNGKYINIFLIPRTTLTNKFEIIKSSIQKISEVIGENFDKFIFSLLSDYQTCGSDKCRYNFLHKFLSTIANYADFFVENNSVDYAEFANENKKSGSSIFFDENEIKNIIKLSEALKIYSLCSNTEKTLSDTNHKKIYNEFVDILTTSDTFSKIYDLCNSLGLQSQKTLWRDYDNLSDYSSNKVSEVFKVICNSGVTICKYDLNPIPFFNHIFNNIAQYKDVYKEKGICYEDDESQDDRDDRFLSNERKRLDLKRTAYSDVLKKLQQKSCSFLFNSHRRQTKKMPSKKGDVLLKNRINQIKHISPFWDIIITPIFSKATGIKFDSLRKQSPKRVAVMSFYLAHLLVPLFNNKFKYLFSLASFYPESEIPESTTYRLHNISHFINSTLNFSNDDLIRVGGSRIKMVRIIEEFIGKMRIRTVRYSNILTGQAMDNIDFNQIELETIDYLIKYFSEKLKTEIEGLKKAVSNDINILLIKTNKQKETKASLKNIQVAKTINNKINQNLSSSNGIPKTEKNDNEKKGNVLDSSKDYRKIIRRKTKNIHRIIDAIPISERKEYFIKHSSYTLKDLTGIINSYQASLSIHPEMYIEVLTYFKELYFKTNFTLYEQNKEVYSNLLKGFNEDIVKTEAFHDAFFACNCIEFGKLINDYYNNKIQQQDQTIVKNLITELETHPTFFERCKNLYEKKQHRKYYVIGINRLSKLIEITENSQLPIPIDAYLSQFSISINHNSRINMGDFLKKIDVAIFMSTFAERDLTITFDEIYPYYHQWQTEEELLLFNIKEGKNLSKHDLSDNRPYLKLPYEEIRISKKTLKKISARTRSVD